MMEFVNGKDDIPYMKWKVIEFHGSKPPTTLDWFEGKSTGTKSYLLGKKHEKCFFVVPVDLPV